MVAERGWGGWSADKVKEEKYENWVQIESHNFLFCGIHQAKKHTIFYCILSCEYTIEWNHKDCSEWYPNG